MVRFDPQLFLLLPGHQDYLTEKNNHLKYQNKILKFENKLK